MQKRTEEIHKANPLESIKVWTNLELAAYMNVLATWVEIADISAKNRCFIAISLSDKAFSPGFRQLSI